MTEKTVFLLASERNKTDALQYLLNLHVSLDEPHKVVFTEGSEARTDKQRRLQFRWYTERGKGFGHGKDYDELFCKLNFGAPIIRRDDEEVDDLFAKYLDPMTYEDQVNAMRLMSVTRLMSVKQNAEYLTDMEQSAAQQGVVLSRPEDLYYESLMREVR